MRQPKLDDASSRQALLAAAAGVFMQDPQLAVNIAGVETAKFVQGARKLYKASGFNFTDSDIREIHRLLRAMVVHEGYGQTETVQ